MNTCKDQIAMMHILERNYKHTHNLPLATSRKCHNGDETAARTLPCVPASHEFQDLVSLFIRM